MSIELREHRSRPGGRRTGRRGMRSLASVTMALAVLAACGGGDPATVVEGDVAFVGVNVLPMDRDRVIENQTVVIAGGRIAAMDAADRIELAEGVDRVEGDGRYLMPGLAEMHGHLPSSRESDEDIRNLLFLYLSNGVTTVRGMQGEPSQFGLRQSIERGLLLGPNLYLGSVSMNGQSVQTPEEADRLARSYQVDGYDLIKTHEGMSLESFDAMAAAANEVGIPFGGHVSDFVGLRRALEAGQVSIDHLDNYVEALVDEDTRPDGARGLREVGALIDEVDESRIPELVQATVDAGAWVVPTMVLWETAFYNDRGSVDVLPERPEVRYMPPETVDRWRQAVDTRLGASDIEVNRRVADLRRRILRALHLGGANIALGTDSPQIFSVPGFAMHHEMALYVDVGMTPYDVLEIGTRRPAEYFGAEDEFGTVAVGLRADLILLDENPIDDIANVRDPAGVMIRGRWIPRDEISERLTEIARFYGN
ncbi:MAG: amidohydrolase family protein [Acidobacteria bacterium]|nr:amidohydrolase family protein [Acidobacteriota bacterium]